MKSTLFISSLLILTAQIVNAAIEPNDMQAVILAAGKSRRFGTEYSKMLAQLKNKPLIVHALEPMAALEIPSILILGYQRDAVRQAVQDAGFENVQYAYQEEQLGTGHAVHCAQPFWSKNNILITYGDMPLINTEIVTKLYQKHKETDADLTLIVASNVDPACSYGRIVINGNDIRIIEKKHFTADIHDYPLVNAGIYLVKREVLEECLPLIKQNSASKEYYFTDVLEIANKMNLRIEILEVPFDAVRGINTQEEYQAVIQLVEGNSYQ